VIVKNSSMKNRIMRNRSTAMDSNTINWAIWGAVVAVAAAGVIYYINHQEEVNSRLGDLRDKASDALGRAKTRMGRQVSDMQSQMQG